MSNYQIGEIYRVHVKEVKPYAAFIVMEDGSFGMLHISELSDRYINDIERFVSPGDEINVKLLEIDDKNGFVRVSYKKVPEDKRFSTHKNVRRALEKDEKSFKTLKEKLPIWIQKALKED